MKEQIDKKLSNEKEYLMLREEILQYLREYQSVRNMMYLVTATTLGFCFGKESNVSSYLFLLPLIVILPSYIIATDYRKNVVRAATYLMVFYEQEEDSIFHWETNLALIKKQCRFMTGTNYQHIPYYVCGILCIILYFGFLDWENICYSDVLLGSGVLVISAVIYIYYREVKDDYVNEWKKIKEERNSNKIEK